MAGEHLAPVFVSLVLPQILLLDDGSEVRISTVETNTVTSRLTLKLQFDEAIVYISVPSVAPHTYGQLVPIIRTAIRNLRQTARALLTQPWSEDLPDSDTSQQ